MDETSKLNDFFAVQALSEVVRQWSDANGYEAVRTVTEAFRLAGEEVPIARDWTPKEKEPSREVGALARFALRQMIDGVDQDVSEWARSAVIKALNKQSEAVAHILDPLTLSIFGGVVIGIILAARVKKIGSAEFYKGVPKEVVNIVKAGAGVVKY